MGQRGPIPTRSDQRRRRNSPDVDKAPAAKKVSVPAADRDWHPIAARWYRSLKRSGQSRFFEPSDWAQAYFVAEGMSRLLFREGKFFSAQLFAAIDAASARLLVTEGDRRRMRIELERGITEEQQSAGVASMNAWREKLTGAGSAGGSN